MWLCICIYPDGLAEMSEWLTQDDADQMAAETEAAGERDGKQVVWVCSLIAASPQAA